MSSTHSHEVLQWTRVLLVLLAVVLLAGGALGCGGCGDPPGSVFAACYDTRRVATTRTTQVCDYYWSTRRCRPQSVVIYSTEKTNFRCCVGFQLDGEQCRRKACGGCSPGAAPVELPCRQTFRATSVESYTYYERCGWWWGTTNCQRTGYRTVYKLNTHLTCCAGYSLNPQTKRCTAAGGVGITSCGASTVLGFSTNIIGGSTAQKSMYPWQVSLRMRSAQSTLFCGGTLINTRWVMTAAHCIKNRQMSQILVVAGDHSLSQTDFGEQTRGVEAMVPHPQYDSTVPTNDIALLRLDGPVSLDIHKQPACLPPSTTYSAVGQTVIISGWGYTSTTTIPDVLQHGTTRVRSKTYCQGVVGISAWSHPGMLCALDTTSPCFGDSGSPMTIRNSQGRYMVVGVASFVIKGCGNNKPFGYVNVAHYRNWILGHAGTN